MKNILLVVVVFVISGCNNGNTCTGYLTSRAPCELKSSVTSETDKWNNDYCSYLINISKETPECYESYSPLTATLRKEAIEYADKMALMRKQEEVPITCIVEKNE